jgi:sRNA-binding protein
MNQTQGNADAIAALWLLVGRYPACFFMLETKRLPLAIGIRDQIIATGAIEPDQLNLALQFYCRSEGYLRALARGGVRIGLEGEPVGVVSPEQAASAAKGLANRLLRKKARKAREAEERPASSGSAGGSVSVKPSRRLSLSDLKQAAIERKAAAQ